MGIDFKTVRNKVKSALFPEYFKEATDKNPALSRAMDMAAQLTSVGFLGVVAGAVLLWTAPVVSVPVMVASLCFTLGSGCGYYICKKKAEAAANDKFKEDLATGTVLKRYKEQAQSHPQAKRHLPDLTQAEIMSAFNEKSKAVTPEPAADVTRQPTHQGGLKP